MENGFHRAYTRATIKSFEASKATKLTLVLGGARSGKSRYAESLITTLPAPWIYVATAQAGDAEMAERIAAHRAARIDGWRTVEAPHEIAQAIAQAPPALPLLVDCLTLWLSNRMLADADVEREFTQVEAALDARAGDAVLVSNEVGGGIVPENALARRFRDLQGRLNARIAARAERVVFLVAGLPLVLKEPR